MIWSSDQLNQAERIWSRGEIEEDEYQAEGGLASLKMSMAKAMIREAHALGVELKAEEMLFGVGDVEEDRPVRKVTVRWHPMTQEIELHGGPADGEVRAWTRLPDSLRVVSIGTDLAHEQAVMYERAGWNEAEGRWVYRSAS